MADKRREQRTGTDVEAERGVTGVGETDRYIGREHDLPIRTREEMEERGADKALQEPDAPRRVRNQTKESALGDEND